MQQPPTLVEIDARLAMLTEQRNSALNHSVLLAGNLAVLEAEMRKVRIELAEALQEIEALKQKLGPSAEALAFRDRNSMTEP